MWRAHYGTLDGPCSVVCCGVLHTVCCVGIGGVLWCVPEEGASVLAFLSLPGGLDC